MEDQNYYPNNRGRYNSRKPYSRGRPQHRGSNFQNHNRADFYSRPRNSNWHQSNDSNYSYKPIRQDFHSSQERYRQPRVNSYQTRDNQPQFDNYSRNEVPYFPQDYSQASFEEDSDTHFAPPVSEEEVKALNLTDSVYAQQGVKSMLIFIETEPDRALQTLQGAIDNCQSQLLLETEGGEYVLKINQEEYARGTFENKQLAKASLAETALEELRKYCFYIVKKKIYEEVDTQQSTSKAETKPSALEGSKAHQMMLKMGWGGKGLGVNEQGQQQTVAEKIDQNITRQGLGSKDVMKEINSILEDFAKSNKLTILRFAPDFTLEERAFIHKIAAKFGLKSKSEGKGDQRRITISKKLNRRELVYQLLVEGCENSVYKLLIPSNFEF